MNIAICFDRNYQKWATVCLNSIWEHHRSLPKIRLVILSDINYDQAIWQLKKVLKNFDFTFDNPGNDFDDMPTGYHFNVTTYWRLALPNILFKYNIDRAIYLDLDTIVLSNLNDLYNFSLDNNTAGGCIDINSQDHVERMTLNQGFAINGGVLLMNVSKMYEINWVKEANDLNQQGRIKWVDQDVLNILLDGKISEIPIEWNVQSGNFQNGYNDEVNIVHFTESNHTKPWSINGRHRFLGVYNTYMRKSGFYLEYFYFELARRIKKLGFFN